MKVVCCSGVVVILGVVVALVGPQGTNGGGEQGCAASAGSSRTTEFAEQSALPEQSAQDPLGGKDTSGRHQRHVVRDGPESRDQLTVTTGDQSLWRPTM